MLGDIALKTLSIHQPYATLIVYGIKRFEFRSWSTDYRGPLLIHASQKEDDFPDLLLFADLEKIERTADDRPDASACEYLQNDATTGRVVLRPASADDIDLQAQYKLIRACADVERDYFPHGAIVGRVELADVESDGGDGYSWRLDQPEVFDDPILNVRGRLRIWDFPIEKHRLPG